MATDAAPASVAEAGVGPSRVCTLVAPGGGGSVISPGFVAAVVADLRPALEDGACGCGWEARLDAPSWVRASVLVDPNVGEAALVGVDLGEGEGPAFEWARFERCLGRRLEAAQLPRRQLGSCADPGGDGGRLVLGGLRVDVTPAP